MTAPENPMNPESLLPVVQTALGLGAYQIGGGTKKFGQEVDEDYVNTLIYGAIPKGNFDLMGSVEEVTSYMGSFLATLPIDILRYTKPFIAGATDDDYADSATAAAYITNALVPKSVVNQLSWLSRLLLDVTILLDFFHVTYPAGSPTDPPGTATYYGAWNDLMDLLDLTGGTNPGDPAPTLGSVVTDTKAKWDAIMSQLTALWTLITGGPVSTANWAIWWSNTLIALGFNSTDSATIANWLSGNYDSAIKAKQWWDQILTALGLGSGTAVGGAISGNASNISTQQAWWTRLAEDLWIQSDLFHIYYPVGTTADTATTTSGGKRTWYSASADLKLLFASIGSTPPVVVHTDIAGTITGNAATAAAATTAAQDAVNQAVTGTTLTGATPAVVNTALGGLQQTVAAIQDQVGALVAPALSPTTILSDDGKSSPGAGLGSNWTRSGVNVIVRDATYGFSWPVSGSSARTELGVYNTPLATTDQVGEIVVNHMMAYDPFNADPENAGIPYNQIILRGNSTTPTSYVFARIRSNHVQFGYAASGVEHLLGSPTTLRANSASGYRFFAGDASSDYHFRLDYNGRTVATYDDSAGHLTIASIAGRYSGQSWTSAPYAYGGEGEPAYTSWRSWDATASAGVPPGFGHITRVSATGVTMTSGFLPYTFFDTTIGTLGANISLPVSGNAGLIVGESSLYTVSFGLRMSSTSNSTDIYPGIAVNGTVQETGSTFMYDGGGTLLNGGQFSMSSGSVLCTAGDLLSPWMGVQSGGGGSGLTGAGGSTWNGDSSGSRAFFKVAKIG